MNVGIEEIEEKIERLKNPIPKAQTETKPSALEIQLERLLQLEEKLLQKTEELEYISLKSQSFVKLPKLDFEKYNGDVLRFQEFWDNFSTSVHDNKRLRLAEKLNYLRAKFEGKGKAAIAGLEITNDNYDVAVKILRDRFGDPQTVISGHYTKLMDLPSSINQTTALRSTFDELEKHLMFLTALGEDTNHRHFVSLIMSKLPREVIIKLEEMKKLAELWSVQLLSKNLQAHLTARENSERQRWTHLPQNIVNKVTASPPKKSSAEALMVGTNPKANYVQTRQLSTKKCVYCQGNYWSDECPRYQTIGKERKGSGLFVSVPGIFSGIAPMTNSAFIANVHIIITEVSVQKNFQRVKMRLPQLYRKRGQ